MVPSRIDIPSDQFVTLDGIRFHYLTDGAGPLIVLYALSVLVGWLFQRAHRRASRA